MKSKQQLSMTQHGHVVHIDVRCLPKRDSKCLYYRSSYLQVILHTSCLTVGEAIIYTCPSFKPFKTTFYETLSIGFTLPRARNAMV